MNFARFGVTATVLTLSASLIFAVPGLRAQGSQNEQEPQKVFESVKWQRGPCDASLGSIADMRVPLGYIFAGEADTKRIMEVMGNTVSGEELGLLAPETFDWFVVYEFDDVGYVKDDEKDSLDPAALLKSIQKSTEQGNKIRRKRGFPGLKNIRWLTEPYYDQQTNNLEWAIQGEDDTGDPFVNHNTRLLGRKGIMVVTLVSDPASVPDVMPEFKTSLKDFAFKAGNTYAEFRSGDKLASYGLTALVAGGAAAVAVKTGLFKYIGKFLIFIAAGLAAFFKKIWRAIRGEDRQPQA